MAAHRGREWTIPVIRGALDTTISQTTVTRLYDDLQTDGEALIMVPCASHFMVWETQRNVLHEVSADWLTDRPGVPSRAQGGK